MIKTLLMIGAGSFVGGILRYLLSKAIQTNVAGGFPWGTLAVNVAGCFAIGLLYGIFDRSCLLNDNMRLFLTVGICGGFTTFSTFVHEGYILIGERSFAVFLVYAVLSLFLGMIAVYAGHLAVKVL